MIIYADMILVVNVLMNSIILLFTALLTGSAIKIWRIIIAAGIGSIYVLASIIDKTYFLSSVGAKLAISIVLVYTVFGFVSLGTFLLRLGTFYVTSFIFGGAVLGWLFFLNEPYEIVKTRGYIVQWMYLFGGVLAGAGLIIVLFRRCISSVNRRKMLYQVHIELGGVSVPVIGMLDTGNGLYTLVGHKPVILVELQRLIPILSPEVVRYLRSNPAHEWLTNLDQCSDTEWLNRVEIVPYCAIGNSSMLIAFRTDGITLVKDNENVSISKGTVAVYEKNLTSDNRYHALLHPGMFQNESKHREGNLCPYIGRG